MKWQSAILAFMFVIVTVPPFQSFAQYNWSNYPSNPRLSDGQLTLEPTVLYDTARAKYDMWYYDLSNVKRAVSNDGVNWVPTGNMQSLTTLFSTGLVACGEVYKVGSTFYMYAGCQGQDGSSWYLGLASSVDGSGWTKHPSSPALIKGASGSWDDVAVCGARITQKDGIYYMYYGGVGANGIQIGLAISTDGVHWEKYGGNPVVGPKAMGPKTTTVGVVGVEAVNGVFYMVMSVKDSLNQPTYNMASSPDGKTWSLIEGNPILKTGSSGGWNSGGIGGGSLRFVSGKYRLWYCGCDYAQTWKIGLATSDYVPQEISVSVPQVVTAAGATQEVPVMITNVSGKGILAYEFTLSFNSPDSVLTAEAALVTAGTLSGQNGWSVLVNSSNSNELHVAAYGATPLSGGGALLKLKFTTVPSAQPGDSTELKFKQFLFNTGSPTPTLQSGGVKVQQRVCGDADENGLIQAYDAAVTLREAIGPMNPPPPGLTAIGRLNADVNMDGKVQAFDAALILRHVVGLPLPESTATCFGGGIAGLPHSLNLSGKLNSARYSGGQWMVQLQLADVPTTMQVLSCSFELTTSAAWNDTTTLALPLLPQGYLATVNRLGNGHYRVGIINPNGVDVAGIPLTLSAMYAGSLNYITLSDLYLNDAPNASAITMANIFTSVEEHSTLLQPQSFDLIGAYPNPFNPSTQIAFATPCAGQVHLEIYNAQGMKVKALLHEQMGVGLHSVTWNGTNEMGQTVASGQYFCLMRAGAYVKTAKLMLLK